MEKKGAVIGRSVMRSNNHIYDRWKNIKDKSFDCVVCGQMFEHCEFFWLSMLEIYRILKPNGICCIIAPSGGPEHRYPVDCYRFYPDGLTAVARYAHLEVLEAYAQWNEDIYPDMDHDWRDCVMICKRPSRSLFDSLLIKLHSRWIYKGSKSACNKKYSNSYSQQTDWRVPMPNLYASLYYDTGNGFNEGQVVRHKIETTEIFKMNYDLPDGCTQIRFDPLEEYMCMVNDFRVFADDTPCSVSLSNGVEKQLGLYFFLDTKDPQLFVPIPSGTKSVQIEAEVKIVR